MPERWRMGAVGFFNDQRVVDVQAGFEEVVAVDDRGIDCGVVHNLGQDFWWFSSNFRPMGFCSSVSVRAAESPSMFSISRRLRAAVGRVAGCRRRR